MVGPKMSRREIGVRVTAAIVLLLALGANVAKAPVKVDTLDVVLLALVLAAIALTSERAVLLSKHVTKVSVLGVEVSLEERAALEQTAARGIVVDLADDETGDDQPSASAGMASRVRRRIELAVADCGLEDIDCESTHTVLLRLFERGWIEPDVFRTLEVIISGRSVPAELQGQFDAAAEAALGRLRKVAFAQAAKDRFRRSGYEVEPYGVRGSERVDFVASRDGRVVDVETALALRRDSKTLSNAIHRLSKADVPPEDQIMVVVPNRSRSLDAIPTPRPLFEVRRLRDIK
jgi:hypothetical protein